MAHKWVGERPGPEELWRSRCETCGLLRRDVKEGLNRTITQHKTKGGFRWLSYREPPCLKGKTDA